MKSNQTMVCGILTGTTFSILPVIYWHDIIRTIILACIGAIVSFIITTLLKYLKATNTKKNE